MAHKKYKGISDKTGDKLEDIVEDLKLRQKLKIGSLKREPVTDFKEWFKRMIMGSIVLLIISSALWYMIFKDDPMGNIILQAVMSLPVWQMLMCTHEYLHEFMAHRLGYTTEFEIEPGWRGKASVVVLHEADKKWDKDRKLIAFLPYVAIVPVACWLLGAGIYFNFWTFTISGAVVLLSHILFMRGDLKAVA